MGKFNLNRWAAASVAAGVVMWVCEGAASALYMTDMKAAMKDHNLAMDMSGATIALTLVISLIAGFSMMFFYAASLPRFDAGVKTAALVAIVLWTGGYLLSLLGYHMVGLYPTGMLIQWGIVGLIEMVLAAALGARIYRDT